MCKYITMISECVTCLHCVNFFSVNVMGEDSLMYYRVRRGGNCNLYIGRFDLHIMKICVESRIRASQ